MTVWLLAIGFISILGQVVLLRELNVAFYGTELIYILAIGVWLFWTAVGAALGRRGYVPPGSRVRLLLLALAVLFPLSVAAIRGLRPLFGAVTGAYLPFSRQLLAMALVLIPVCVLLGLLFQWVAKLYVGRRGTLAAAYAIESAGGLAGGVLATVFLMGGLQNFAAGLLCALLAAAAAAHPPGRDRPRWLAPAGLTISAGLVVALAWSTSLDRGMTAWTHPRLLATRDTPYSRVTLVEASGQVAVFENDALAFDTEGTGAEEFSHLAALQHPAPRTVLLLGGGAEGLVRELLLHRPRRIDYVEINRELLEVLSPRLSEVVRRPLEDGAVELVIADPRRFLRGGPSYDLILVSMPEPSSGQTNRFYTREFFALCAGRLARGGVLALRLRGAENLWTPSQARRTASIHHALRAVFGDVVILPGSTNVILASDAPLAREPAVLAERFAARGIEARLVGPAYLDYLYTNDRFFELAGLMEEVDAPVNLDSRPVCYAYTLVVWLSRFFPGLASLRMPAPGLSGVAGTASAWTATIVLALAFLLSRRGSTVRRSMLAGVAGLGGMVLESVLILHYQTVRGALFQDLGILLTTFMAGLALGAALVHRRASRGARLTRAGGVGLLVGLAALSLVVARIPHAPGGPVTTAALLLLTGVFVAAIFAYASLHREPDQKRVVSPLYSADLLGGCAGSLAASLFLIPVLGLAGSALVVGLLAAAALALV